jgi:hypothetical protein
MALRKGGYMENKLLVPSLTSLSLLNSIISTSKSTLRTASQLLEMMFPPLLLSLHLHTPRRACRIGGMKLFISAGETGMQNPSTPKFTEKWDMALELLSPTRKESPELTTRKIFFAIVREYHMQANPPLLSKLHLHPNPKNLGSDHDQFHQYPCTPVHPHITQSEHAREPSWACFHFAAANLRLIIPSSTTYHNLSN